MKCPVCDVKIPYKKLKRINFECEKCTSKLRYNSSDSVFVTIIGIQAFLSWVVLRMLRRVGYESSFIIIFLICIPVLLTFWLMSKKQSLSVIEKRDKKIN